MSIYALLMLVFHTHACMAQSPHSMHSLVGEASAANTETGIKSQQTQLKGVCFSSQFHSIKGKAQGLTGSIRGGRSL